MLYPQTPTQATTTTCSGGLPLDMTERFQLLADVSPVIVLAEITASDDIPPEGVSPLVGIARTATFSPVVVLKAEQALEELTIGPLRGTAPDCSGGPVMLPGERVLLFLTPQEQYPVAEWRVGVFGDVVRFEGDQAVYAFAGDIGQQYTEPAGAAAQVIDALAGVLSLDAETRAAAYTFVGSAAPAATAVPSSTGSTPITPPDTGDAGLR